MFRLIRRHPILGLLAGLSVEAWLALPGETLIAVAAAAVVNRAQELGRMMIGGVTGMLINDLTLFGLSRLGRGVLVGWIGLHGARFHLSADWVMGAKFFPPLRSTAYLIYGLQGVSLGRFLEVSLLSSTCWILVYAVLGRRYRDPIQTWLGRWESRGNWAVAAEIGLTLAVLAAVWL